jgi:Formyl transferase
MKTLLICHESAGLDEQVLARWLHSFSELVGLVLLQDPPSANRRRVRREIKRVGIVRFLDVLAFRLYYRVFLAAKDQQWERQQIDEFCRTFESIPSTVPVLKTRSVNAPETEQFVRRLEPDLVLARCKALLNERIFSIPTKGTFVMHPGVCPEYRNAHGCFWALAERDLTKVGMTLLKIDPGVDTGPVFGYYSYAYDEVNESHIVIQHRVVLENLKSLQSRLMDIFNDTAAPVDTTGRPSKAWGQPWLSRYLSWKAKARNRGK